jgi:hypothetical protein
MDKWKNYLEIKEQDNQTLLLANTNLVFKKLETGEQERLACIYVNGHGKQEPIYYEQGTYCFCE